MEPHFFGTQVYVKAHFRYIPENDRLLPAKEAGLPFVKGDILEVLSQEDTFWWQASKYGSHSAAGLIPSQQLEERRKTFNLSENGNVGCMGRRKPKRQLIYSSHHNGSESSSMCVRMWGRTGHIASGVVGSGDGVGSGGWWGVVV